MLANELCPDDLQDIRKILVVQDVIDVLLVVLI